MLLAITEVYDHKQNHPTEVYSENMSLGEKILLQPILFEFTFKFQWRTQ